MKQSALHIVCALFLATAPTLQSFGGEALVDTLEFNAALATSPAKIVLGAVSGVRVFPVDGNVNGVMNTLIRGVNSIRSDSQPLWIVDGVEINSDLSKNRDAFFQYGEKSYTAPLNAMAYLDPYNFERIEVLKDLAATAIYGNRGANGVIVITTKKMDGEGFKIDWNSDLGVIHNAISHSHHILVGSSKGQTGYTVSGMYRSLNGAINGNDQKYGSLHTSFYTRANSSLWFGMDLTAALGSMNSVTGTSYFGQPSLTMSLRNSAFFANDTREGWESDYDDEAIDRRLSNGVWVTLNINKFLSLKTSIGLDFQNNNRYIWYGNGTSFGKENNGAAAVIGTTVFKYNAKSVLSYSRYFGRVGHFVFDTAAEMTGEWTKFNTLNGTNFFSQVLRAHGIELAASRAVPHKFDHEYNSRGAYLRLGYDKASLTGLDGVIRIDNTPRYDDGRVEVQKSGSVWFSVKDALLPAVNPISTLKLYAGYGEAGREQYVPYGLYGQFISGDYPKVEESLSIFYEGLNRNRSAEWSLSLDAGFLQDRYTVKLAYYDKYTTDNFYSYCFGKAVDDHYWAKGKRSEQFAQTTLIGNRGFEADLHADILRGGLLRWDVGVHAAYNVNQLLKVDGNDSKGRAVGSGVFANANVIGCPVGALYGYKVDANDNFIDTNKDGTIDEYDKDIIGNPNPKCYGTLDSVFGIGRFTLNLILSGAAGFDILNMNDLLFKGRAPYEISEIYVEKGDYLKMERVSIGYDLPLKYKWLKGCRISFSARDLFTMTSYSGWDPEVNCFGISYLSSGVDYGSYPKYASYSLGINLKF